VVGPREVNWHSVTRIIIIIIIIIYESRRFSTAAEAREQRRSGVIIIIIIIMRIYVLLWKRLMRASLVRIFVSVCV